jgi:hypothetical protein
MTLSNVHAELENIMFNILPFVKKLTKTEEFMGFNFNIS